MDHEAAVRLIEGDAEMIVVNYFEGQGIAGGLAACAQICVDDGGQFGVENNVLEAVAVVFHGDFHAVRPLQALADLEIIDGEVVIDGVFLDDVGGHVTGVSVHHGQQVLGHHDVDVGVIVRGDGAGTQGSAVGTDLELAVLEVLCGAVIGDLGVLGQALLNRGQLAGFNTGVEHGGLAVLALSKGSERAHAQQHRQHENQRQFLHAGILLILFKGQTHRTLMML